MALSDVASIARDIRQVRENLETLSAQVKHLAEQAPRPEVPGLMEAGKTLQTSAEALREGVEYASGFIGYLSQLRDDFDDQRFREQLDVFLADAAKLAAQISRLLIVFRVPATLEEGFRHAVLRNVPSLFLLPVSLGLDALPGWETIPGRVLETLERLDPVGKSAAISDELYVDVIDARMRLQVLERILETIVSLLPSDLSIQLSAIGEGGGTEIMGHPIKLPFEAVDMLLDLVELILTSHIEIAQRMTTTR